MPRERIAELLWGDRAEPQARASLRQALLEIRHSAPGDPELIGSDRGHLWLNESAVEMEPEALEQCGSEYFPFEDLNHVSPEFDHWLELERSRRIKELAHDLRRQAEELLVAGRADEALELAEAMQQLNPYDEEALRLAMKADFQSGHAAAIEQRFQALEKLLNDDLGVEPSPESRELRDKLVDDCRGVRTQDRDAE